jgi:hypothetical protein
MIHPEVANSGVHVGESLGVGWVAYFAGVDSGTWSSLGGLRARDCVSTLAIDEI